MEALTETQPDPTDPSNKPNPPEDPAEKRNKKIQQQVDLTKIYRRKLIKDWQVSVDYRRGKPFASQSDFDRIAVPVDWTMVKQKQSALWSQVPQARISHTPQTLVPGVMSWLHAFEQRINDIALEAGIDSVMDECLPDCINCSGFGACIVMREAITEEIEVPAIDISVFPPQFQQIIMTSGKMPDGSDVPMTKVPREIDSRYTLTRLSPADFLWPIGFQSSDFDKAPWLGRTGRVPWATALQRFGQSEERPNGLTEEDQDKVMGDDRSTLDRIDRLRAEAERGVAEQDDTVSFDEVFYHEHSFDPACTSYATIRHLVFVHGKEKAVIDEEWKGQQLDKDSNQIVGALKYPIRVLTLSYVSDDAIPPSDSAVSRPATDEINKSRSQMIQQRQHSLPAKWVNTDRIDPAVLLTLMRGTWQGYVPIQGVGTNAIGEVGRSAFPPENFAIDKIAKQDIKEAWGSGGSLWNTQMDGDTQGNDKGFIVDARIARERAKVGKFFIGIAEVIGGLVSIFEDPSSFGDGFSPMISKTLSYSILADSTVLLDSNQRLKRLTDFVNFAAKSGWMDIESVLKEAATLTGLDPNTVIKAPQPKPPVEPNISLRLTGTEDMLNPLTLAFLINSGQAPTMDQIEQAKSIITAAVTPPAGLTPTPSDQGAGLPMLPPGAPPPAGTPVGPDGQPISAPNPPGAPPTPPPPPPAPPAVGEANPKWTAMDRLNRRTGGKE